MNFSELEAVRSHWKLDAAEMARLLGLEDGEKGYTNLGDTVPGPVAKHVETLKMVRGINRGVFNNYLTKAKTD